MTSPLALSAPLQAADIPADGVQRPGGRSSQKHAAEAERALLQQKLATLKKAIDGTETRRGQAAEALAKSDAAISDASRALHELAQEQSRTQENLAELTRQQRALEAVVMSRRQQLSALLREQYIAGNEDRIKLLLSGQDPAQIGRSLRYLGYVSQAQTRLIEALQHDLQTIGENQAGASVASAELEEIATEAQAQKARLEQEKSQRTATVSALARQLSAQRAEAGKLERDDNRLGSLVTQLGKLIEQQQKAEAEAQEKRRRQLALQARQAERAAQKAAQKADRSPKSAIDGGRIGRSDPKDRIDADDPPAPPATKILRGNEPALPLAVQGATDGLGFARLRGRLVLPLKGELLARFGTRRDDGPNWKGLFIRAAEGAPVHAVAAGRVVFAEWLRGFGNLIIVDHGSQYLTIYGNNQAVLKHAGDQVISGETIASAGNTGGNEQSGLYFEMRFQGRAFDPLGWVTSR